MSERAELVTKLVREGPLSSSEFDRLHTFDWDSEDDLVTLTKADALAMLGRYVRGHVTADDLIRWAGQIEFRETSVSRKDMKLISSLIFELATQEIHPAWNSDTANRWLVRLA